MGLPKCFRGQRGAGGGLLLRLQGDVLITTRLRPGRTAEGERVGGGGRASASKQAVHGRPIVALLPGRVCPLAIGARGSGGSIVGGAAATLDLR